MKSLFLILFCLSLTGLSQPTDELRSRESMNLKGNISSIEEVEIRLNRKQINKRKFVETMDTIAYNSYIFHPNGMLKYHKSIVNDGSASGYPEYIFDSTGLIISYRWHTPYPAVIYQYTYENSKVIKKESKGLDSLFLPGYVEFFYDEIGLLSREVRFEQNGDKAEETEFTYFPNGLVAQKRTVCCNSGGKNLESWVGIKYEYDEESKLIREEWFYSDLQKKYIHFYTYDTLENIISDSCSYTYSDEALGMQNGYYISRYTYNLQGDLDSKSFRSHLPFAFTDDWKYEYTYDAQNNWVVNQSTAGSYSIMTLRKITYF